MVDFSIFFEPQLLEWHCDFGTRSRLHNRRVCSTYTFTRKNNRFWRVVDSWTTRNAYLKSFLLERVSVSYNLSEVRICGWGDMASVGQEYPDTLRCSNTQYIERSVCNSPNHYDGEIYFGMICAGELNVGGKDGCQELVLIQTLDLPGRNPIRTSLRETQVDRYGCWRSKKVPILWSTPRYSLEYTPGIMDAAGQIFQAFIQESSTSKRN